MALVGDSKKPSSSPFSPHEKRVERGDGSSPAWPIPARPPSLPPSTAPCPNGSWKNPPRSPKRAFHCLFPSDALASAEKAAAKERLMELEGEGGSLRVAHISDPGKGGKEGGKGGGREGG